MNFLRFSAITILLLASAAAFADGKHGRKVGYQTYGQVPVQIPLYQQAYAGPCQPLFSRATPHRWGWDYYVTLGAAGAARRANNVFGGVAVYGNAFGLPVGSCLAVAAAVPIAPLVQVVPVVKVPVTVQTAKTPAKPKRQLVLDAQGNYFEVATKANGDQVNRQLDPSECEL